MSATAIKTTDRRIATGTQNETEDTCKVVVFYEDSAARTGAMRVCERLVEQFAEDLDFEFKWWKFKRVTDPLLARHAIETAKTADIVMFCPDSVELTPEMADWIENWAESGSTSDGAITLVLPAQTDSTAALKSVSTFKWVAQRLGMDFLHVTVPPSTVPEPPAVAEPTIPMSSPERPHISHWGLND